MCSPDNMRMMCEIEDRILKMICAETSDGLENVETEELGEAVDMVKDLAKAKYYASVVEAMNAEKYGDMPARHSEGRYGPEWEDGSMERMGAYDHYKMARTGYHGSMTAENRAKMERHADEYMREVEAAIRDIWKDADQMHREKMKSHLMSMASGLM